MSISYGKEEQRARNLVWNAAGCYDMDIPFLAFLPSGEADIYRNTILGLLYKWSGNSFTTILRFFASYQHSHKQELFDELLFLALESYTVEKELPERPVLLSMRKDYAKRWYHSFERLSRQEMMAGHIRLFEMQQYRWAKVLGKKLPRLSSNNRMLAEELEFSASIPAADLAEHMQDILIRYFHFHDFRLTAVDNIHRNGINVWLQALLHREHHHVDSLLVRYNGETEDSKVPMRFGAVGSDRITDHTDADLEYIQACFGPSILTEKEQAGLEAKLCREDHIKCHLYVTKGFSPDSNHYSANHEARLVREANEKQHKKNLALYEKSYRAIEAGIKNLSASLETLLQYYEKPLPVKAKQGQIIPSMAYRLPLFHDNKVFLKPGDEVDHMLCVDVLLDASASRVEHQSEIAIQGYMLAKALEKLHLPVSVSCFHSLRSYTVLDQLKSYEDHDARKIFRYSAAGWNRDGLCLRLLKERIRKDDGHQHLVIVMTDAHPSDSTDMPPEEGSIFKRQYDGYAALQDTRNAVQELREDHIMVGAVFTGVAARLCNVSVIYGKEYIRVRKIQELSLGFCSLIQMMLREIRD